MLEYMRTIHKKIITDSSSRPVAVEIDYADWLEIERSLNLPSESPQPKNLLRYSGSISLTEDPLAYQNRIRGDWS